MPLFLKIESKFVLEKLLVTISDVTEVTGIPQRKLRYWEEKWIIQSSYQKDGTTRKFNYLNIKKNTFSKLQDKQEN